MIGEERQQRLSASSVFIIGCGALGGQLAMLLAGAGVGRIGIADFDTIDITNLQRQLFFDENSLGKSKSDVLAKKLSSLNSEVEIIHHKEMISRKNYRLLLSGYDMIADATDNPATKYFIDEVSKEMKAACCLGGVAGWRGQVVIFANSGSETGLTYKDIFPIPESDPSMLPCEIEGVMGPAASTIASIQASEIIQFLIRKPEEQWRERMIALDLSIPSMNVVNLS